MNADPVELFGAALGGGLAGWLFFAALWLTVRGLPASRRPALQLLASLLARGALLAAALYWLGDGDPRRFAAALAGVLLARLAWTRRLRPRPAQPKPL